MRIITDYIFSFAPPPSLLVTRVVWFFKQSLHPPPAENKKTTKQPKGIFALSQCLLSSVVQSTDPFFPHLYREKAADEKLRKSYPVSAGLVPAKVSWQQKCGPCHHCNKIQNTFQLQRSY